MRDIEKRGEANLLYTPGEMDEVDQIKTIR